MLKTAGCSCSVMRSKSRLTPFKLSNQSLNLTSYTQKHTAKDTHCLPPLPLQTTRHLIELIDDSLGYVTRTGNRRNEERRRVCFLWEDRRAQADVHSSSGHTCGQCSHLYILSYRLHSVNASSYDQADEKLEAVAVTVCSVFSVV